MCGIAGIIHSPLTPGELQEALTRMEQSIIHRGPDEGATYLIPLCDSGFAARRLSIVDLEHGHQPMANEDGSVIAMLNGEIYNHQTLQNNLTSLGYRFRGHSDTEAVLRSYEQYGPDCLTQFNGMFAIAIYDVPHRRLLIARDGPGMKPLYFAETPRGFIFGSEVRALFASRLIDPQPDPAGICAGLAAGYTPAPLTPFRGVQKLKAGEWLTLDRTGIRKGAFWRYRYPQDPPKRSDNEYFEEFDSLLRDAVRTHMAADVPVGAFLSGGWDSSLTTTLATRHASGPLKTFSLVFPDNPRNDEKRYSRSVAARIGSEHHEIEYRNAMLPAMIPNVARHLEEPTFTVPTALFYQLASVAGPKVKTVLSGEGSDEIFAGYPWFRTNYPYYGRYFVPRPLARWIAPYASHPYLSRGLRLLAAPDGPAADFEFKRMASPEDKRQLLRPDLFAEETDLSHLTIPPEVAATCRDRLQRRLAFDFLGRLADGVFLNGDKMAMAHSLEMRMPFVDRAIVDFALRLPSRLKLHGGREKIILSRAARAYLPPEIADRRKQGLGYPIRMWGDPACLKFARELLLDAGDHTPFNRQRIEKKMPSLITERFHRIGRLVHLQAWWNEFFVHS